jgi:hypothetical protein
VPNAIAQPFPSKVRDQDAIAAAFCSKCGVQSAIAQPFPSKVRDQDAIAQPFCSKCGVQSAIAQPLIIPLFVETLEA